MVGAKWTVLRAGVGGAVVLVLAERKGGGEGVFSCGEEGGVERGEEGMASISSASISTAFSPALFSTVSSLSSMVSAGSQFSSALGCSTLGAARTLRICWARKYSTRVETSSAVAPSHSVANFSYSSVVIVPPRPIRWIKRVLSLFSVQRNYGSKSACVRSGKMGGRTEPTLGLGACVVATDGAFEAVAGRLVTRDLFLCVLAAVLAALPTRAPERSCILDFDMFVA